MRRLLVTIVLWILGFYVLCLVGLYLLQDMMLFPGGPGGSVRPSAGIKVEWRELRDGTRFRLAIADPGANPKGAVVFFTGNGEDMTSGVYWAQCFQEYGYHTVVPEYPGYGESEGRPTFDSLNEMAEVAAVEGQNLVRGTNLPLYVGGVSLGTFCAVHVAAQGTGQKLLLAAPPTGVVDVGQHKFWWLPVRWLIKHPFDSLAKAPAIEVPVLVIHGEHDRIIPCQFGKRLAAAFPNCRLQIAKGATHNTLYLNRSGAHGSLIESFLAQPPSKR
ncbi:MAG: alpha/beta hydrolase [Planctomycetota bacterium]